MSKFKSVGVFSIPRRMRRPRRAPYLVFLLLPVLVETGFADRPRPRPRPAEDAGQRLAALLEPFPGQALVAFSARDALTGETLFEHEAGRNAIPASTLKLITTWCALERMGPDKRFTTGLYYRGKIAKGRLDGHLIVQGGGDPAFGSRHFGESNTPEAIFARWLKELRDLGIEAVNGCVQGDASYLESAGPSPGALWEDIGNYYGGVVSGLSFHDNMYRLFFAGAEKPGRPVRILGTQPRHTGIARFENRVLTGPRRSGDSAYIFGSPLAPLRLVKGTYPAGRKRFSIKGSLPHPGWTCARELRTYLSAHGIRFEAPGNAEGPCSRPPEAAPSRPPEGGRVLIAEHSSPPLRDIIRHVNQNSDNNYAEQLLALLGRGAAGKGEAKSGLLAAHASLASLGLDRSEVHLKDGSGLSRSNWISPRQFSLFLAKVSGKEIFPDYRQSLLDGGETGGRLQAFYGPGWGDKLWAKTGTLEGVYGLAGYLKPQSGRLVAFALLVNHFDEPRENLHRLTARLLSGLVQSL